MSGESKFNPKIETIRLELAKAVGEYPLPPRKIPIEFRRRILELWAEGIPVQEISRAIGINSSNFYLWKKEIQDSGRLEEVAIASESARPSPKITFTDAKKHLTIEGLSFQEILALLKERVF
jgi:transposase-like protein